jgi:hypothetical protein
MRIAPMNEHDLALIRFARLSGWWNLNREEQASLIGLSVTSLPLKLRSLTPAVERRIAGLVAVWEASRHAGESPEWLRHKGNWTGGHSPLYVLAEGNGAVDAILGALEPQTGAGTDPPAAVLRKIITASAVSTGSGPAAAVQ